MENVMIQEYDFDDEFDKTVAMMPDEIGDFDEPEATVAMKASDGEETEYWEFREEEQDIFEMTATVDPMAELQKLMQGNRNIRGVASICEIGKREKQQDACRYTVHNNNELFAVIADGIGSYARSGEISNLIVDSMMNCYKNASDTADALITLVECVNNTVNEYIRQNQIVKAGSTVVALRIRNGQMNWVSVGDSKLYLLRDGQLIQQNKEHNFGTLLDEQVLLGRITEQQAKQHPKRAALTSFIGMGKIQYIDYSREPELLEDGDKILIATDGILHSLTEQQILDVMENHPQQAAIELKEKILVCNNKYQDNYTAVIIEM